MSTHDPHEAPAGHIAIPVGYGFSCDPSPTCDECSMHTDGMCQCKSPHGCSELDRKDRCRVIFKRKDTYTNG